MPTHYGRSPWLDRFPKARIPAYPQYRGAQSVDAVIIGGGLTGCATAYAFAVAGVKTVLLEEHRIGQGVSASAAGWIADDPGVSFADVEKALGRRSAKYAFQSWRRAALDFVSLIKRLDLKCDLQPRPAITVAMTPDQTARLKREQKARRDAGLDAPLLASRAIAPEVGLNALAGLRGRDGATIDPYRAALGLAAAAKDRGVAIFERSPVKKITFTRKSAEVFTASGRLRTKRIIVATGMPTALFRSLARHFWFHTAYQALTEPVPAKIRKQLGRRTTVVRDAAQPPHILHWVDDSRLLVTGADGEAAPARQRDKVIVQRTGQLMYELSTMYPDVSGIQPAYGWAADYARTEDGLPYIGAHRNYPWHLFAFGDSSHSVTGAYLASRVLLRQYFEEMDPADEVFGFHR